MSASVIYSSILSGAITPTSVTSPGIVQAEQLTSTDDADVTGTLTAGDAVITGDFTAGGGHRTPIGPFIATLAADQTDTIVRLAGFASCPNPIMLRAGSIVGVTSSLSAAITGSSKTLACSATIGGTIVAATQQDYTTGGAETSDSYSCAKDTALHTFSALGVIGVKYTTTTITNTPVLSVWVWVEQ